MSGEKGEQNGVASPLDSQAPVAPEGAGRLVEAKSPSTPVSSSHIPFDLDDTIPERPPSSSYAPTSLTPFRPLEVPALPDAKPAPGQTVRIIGGITLGLVLVAVLVGTFLLVVSAG